MKYKSYLLSCVIALGGCTVYELEPLATNHPAHPEAMAAPQSPVSKTLAYTRAEIPSAGPASALPVAQSDREAHPLAQNETVVGEGKVIATLPNANQIVLEHGEIKGFMEAMTMGYIVESPSLLDSLKFGDKVRFTIDVPKKAIVKIEKLS